MTTHGITFTGLLANFAGIVLFYKASTAAVRPGADPARLHTLNHIAFALVSAGFCLEFLGAGLYMPK
jgi:hypothetical protein